ncbi:MAG TPA: penicillin-binding protein activator LpoB [Bacteroidales bacterium]|nr:MAG: penicillin-binding protein activator LpoB [Bacteroidetes bacterium GWE2_42_24]OFY25245.1 MAG: penicillin-binding protein activator LpoB [Bacteroidetes bacterium GWF2_43_11]PKP19229.1 MAG: penicillin-binding protein activator LpoB [Bacteroidetes bacterium HGW-Bacteroidetes-22]HAQ65930.1 penicillin-binding protein activator LpoB [Bacteroidales bacterium]HBZ66946.1 penicillin-binding protein activator LpoB [Bacteroidales bacterium]
MKSFTKLFGIATFAAITLVSCQSRQVTRVSPDQTIDLSGRWNDTDARLTGEAMIQDALGTTWLTDFTQQAGKKPVVIVGFVKNKTSEHIDAEPFMKDLERAFINSGRVRLVQSGEKREQIRAERADQQDFAATETIKKWGREVGADFMLQGNISQIMDSYNKEKVYFYQVNLELTNMETNEIVWIGEKKIKKYVNK